MQAHHTDHDALFKVSAYVAELLASRRFAEVAEQSGRVRLSAAEIEAAVDNYPGTLIPLPVEAKDLLDVVRIDDPAFTSWSVVQPLYTAEEGRSDLSLLLTVVTQNDGELQFQVDDIHVL